MHPECVSSLEERKKYIVWNSRW